MTRALCFLACAMLGCSNAGGQTDGGTSDASSSGDVEAGVVLAITTADTTPQPFVPGAAVQLAVVMVNADGTTSPLPSGTPVTWAGPGLVVAADPNDAGGAMLPSLSPLAFFVANAFRPDRSDYDGVLFVVQQGNTDNPNAVVTANVQGYGTVTAYVPVRAALAGDPDAGAAAYQSLKCHQCHGPTGAGSPPNDAGTYTMQGASYAFPAPALNACQGSCAYNDGGSTTAPACACAAADPTWSDGFFGLAGQADIDNTGTALRSPMPDFFGSSSAQQFVDIYAFLRTQSQ